jgi:hypothetical protein
MKQTFHIVKEVETPAEPDVLLFSTIDPTVLIVGTYRLQNGGSRTGSLLLYKVEPLVSPCPWYSTPIHV